MKKKYVLNVDDLFEVNRYISHYATCDDDKPVTNDYSGLFVVLDDNRCQCTQCKKIYAHKGIYTHIWRMHGKGRLHNPNRGYGEGTRVSCTKGLTKETCASVKQVADKLRGRPGRKGWHHTDETKRKLSLIKSANNNGGKCKWYTVEGQRVQGTWERDIAQHMMSLKIKWRKLSGKKDVITYHRKGVLSYYLPDFILKDYRLLLEIKGYWWGDDLNKMCSVFAEHIELLDSLFVVEEQKYYKLIQTNTELEFISVLQDRSIESQLHEFLSPLLQQRRL